MLSTPLYSLPWILAALAPGDWSMFRGSQALQGVADGTVPDAPVRLWTFEAGAAIASSAVVADGRVYFGSDDMHVYAVDAASGEKVWSFATEDIVEAPPMVKDGTLYVGGHDFFLYALDAATGELRWKRETDDKILGSANWVAREDGKITIVTGSYDTNLYGFDAEDGKELWRYKTDNYVNGSPAVAGDRIIFGGCDAGLHVVSAQTGKRLAKLELGESCNVAGSVGVYEDRAYFGHYGNAFICVDLKQNEVVWSYDNPRYPFFSSPAITAERVVFGGRDKLLHCVRRTGGEPLWTFKTRRKVDSSPVVCGDRVVFGTADGRLYLLDLATGKEIWSYEIGRSLIASPAVSDGRIFIGSTDGKLYAFGVAQ